MTVGASPSPGFEVVDPSVLTEQVAYYRARATEYDAWFNREGRYDRGEAATTAWRAELAEVRSWVRSLGLDGRDVLELAPGTGIWTELLVESGATVTAVDAAPEMLAQLVERVGTDHLECIEADLFSWAPSRRYDAVVSFFFMSHVPDERLGGFLGQVRDALAAGGEVFLLDGQRAQTSTAVDHVLPAEGDQTMRRRLEDGREFTIVKRFRTDEELRGACAANGLDVTVARTKTYFQAVRGRASHASGTDHQ
jgi:cyclopropane fatty-acyl-phospholipid synthase-like methyltransferase